MKMFRFFVLFRIRFELTRVVFTGYKIIDFASQDQKGEMAIVFLHLRLR